MTSPMHRLDRATRTFWRLRGRPVDLVGAERWLDGPMHAGQHVGDTWLHAEATRVGGVVADPTTEAGLLASMELLDGPGFRAADLHPLVRDFYERTSTWRMEVWTQWNPVLQPGGELVTRLFGRRVQQLALPTRPLDVAHGMDSRVVPILDADGVQRAAGWLRTLRSTGEYVFSGCYSVRRLPTSDRPSVSVVFPLESGNVQVFLRPDVLPGGALGLTSTSGSFGQDGTYVVVDSRGTHAARVPLHETFRVFVDDEGTLRTDHELRLRSARVIRLHYKLTPGA
ncbi:hypothetical protein [Aeromicrobium sp. IC_218]|uniref:hypothetical protein n=1 Tax=Aeromicrobium sp. IC_218 TaxID=2545468 RepID=UPI001F617FD6|nr:hypothetical protein [Aeromicrobium sp. IC_218]